MRTLIYILLSAVTISVASCARHTDTSATTTVPKTARTLVLDSKEFKESKPGEFVSWKCREYPRGIKVLFEVGQLSLPEDFMDEELLNSDEHEELDDEAKEQLAGLAQKFVELVGMFGFILYDGTNEGERTTYTRKGLNQRWDWGPEGKYSFVIKPDGTGLFYDFTTSEDGVKERADDVYKCSK